MSKKITYYMAPVSPWTYLGHGRLIEIAERHAATIEIRPMDLGNRIFPISGGLPLSKRSPQRQAYRMAELKRWRDYLALPLVLEPKCFPTNAELASLCIVAAAANGGESQLRLAGALLKACWVGEQDVALAGTILDAASACGIDGPALLAAANGTDARAQFDQFTELAVADNVFGAPTYVYGGELFWGQDQLDFLDRALARG